MSVKCLRILIQGVETTLQVDYTFVPLAIKE